MVAGEPASASGTSASAETASEEGEDQATHASQGGAIALRAQDPEPCADAILTR